MKRVSIFLITIALIVGMGGCAHTAQYTLSVLSTPGGTVTHPGIGSFTHPAGAVVLVPLQKFLSRITSSRTSAWIGIASS